MRAAGLMAVLLGAATFAGAGQSPPGPELAIGLVRPDGILVPVALSDGTNWVNPWPEPGEERSLDQMIEALPTWWRERHRQPPQVWHLADRASNDGIRLNVLTHVIYDDHCQSQIGMLTDLPKSREKPSYRRLATSWPEKVHWPVDLLSGEIDRAAWRALMDAALQEAAKRELLAIRENEEETRQRSQLEPPAERKPITLTAAYGFAEGNRRIVYFEAERRYAKSIFRHPNAEPSALKASGWIIVVDREQPRALESTGTIGGPEFKGIAARTPLGIIRQAGSSIWVVTEHGYESESAALLRVDAKGVHRILQTFIGGC